MSQLDFIEVIANVPLEVDIERVEIRLPNSIVPSSYNVELQVDLERFTFNGTVLINLEVAASREGELAVNNLRKSGHFELI